MTIRTLDEHRAARAAIRARALRARLEDRVQAQVEGRSLVPLLINPKADWPDRTLVSHVGRWKPGEAPEKYGDCSIRDSRFSMVRTRAGWQLFDLTADPGESQDVSGGHPEVVKQLSAAYDTWWDAVVPCLVNEDAYKTAPAVNPFKAQYWKQFGGGPAASKP